MPNPSKRPVKRAEAGPRRMATSAPVEHDEGDEDEAPTPPRRSRSVSSDQGEAVIHSGWTEGQRQMDSTSSFAQVLKLDEKALVIKFLQDAPYASFRRHWIERTNVDGTRSRLPFTCPLTFDRECPLCEVGDRPQAVSAFNVALCGDDGQVLLKSWDVGARLFNVLKAYNNDPKIAPLTRGFFVVSKTGGSGRRGGGTVQYNVIPVKATALEEDYDVPVPSEDELSRLQMYTTDIIEIPNMKTLREIAAEIADDYE
jgi:hypothetical protein